MFVYHCIWSLGHATDYLFPDCQSFTLANSFSSRFSKFPTSSIHVLLLYLDLAISYKNNSVSRQSLTRQRLAAIVNELIWQSICLRTCFCQVIVLAIWNFFCIKNKESIQLIQLMLSNYADKQAKSSLNNMTFEKSYQQNSLHQGALRSSAYLSSQSVKELLECRIWILNISRCPGHSKAIK